MNTKGFIMCAKCTNKQFMEINIDGRAKYYCALVDGVVNKGIVYNSTDATDCIKWGLFKSTDDTTNN